MKEKYRKKKLDGVKIPLILLFVVVFLWSLCWFLSFRYITGCSAWTERGQFGDMFGAVNALFSGLAFAGIIFTILLQKEELKAQRQELKLTRREFELTRNEYVEQNLTLNKQRFDNTFFNLLNIYLSIVEKSKLPGRTSEGYSIYDAIARSLDDRLKYSVKADKTGYLQYRETYYEAMNLTRDQFRIYLHSVIALTDAITNNEQLSKMDKIHYLLIVKSYISRSQGILLKYAIALESHEVTPSILRLKQAEMQFKFIDNLDGVLFAPHHEAILASGDRWE